MANTNVDWNDLSKHLGFIDVTQEVMEEVVDFITKNGASVIEKHLADHSRTYRLLIEWDRFEVVEAYRLIPQYSLAIGSEDGVPFIHSLEKV